MRRGARLGEATTRLAEHVAPLALLAAVLALAIPSPPLARHSDLLLAALVLLTALAIAPGRLLALRERLGALAALSIGPFLVLTAVAWALGHAFAEPTREGILALGLSSSEVASVGLVALAGGDAVLALGALTGSLICSATLGPLMASALAHTAGHASTGELLGRFTLVVLVPLLIGLAARQALPDLRRAEGALSGLSALTVFALIYAALSGISAGQHLGPAALASLAFLLASAIVALAATRLLTGPDATAVALPTGLRDFAVAAALATQAFGPAAAAVAGVYGVLMLITGALAATMLKRADARQNAGSAQATATPPNPPVGRDLATPPGSLHHARPRTHELAADRLGVACLSDASSAHSRTWNRCLLPANP